jgi:hypothetical protein
MKCIDAIEGVIISVLKEFFSEYCPSKDDSEFALNVKIIIKAVDRFVREHREIIGDSEILRKILFEFSRDLWIEEMLKRHNPEEADLEKEKEYYTYYFNHLYNQGIYPP